MGEFLIAETAGGVGLGYAALSGIANGGGLTAPQANWFGATGLQIPDITNGSKSAAACASAICSSYQAVVRARHIQSDPPGTVGANGEEGNLFNQGNFNQTLTAVSGPVSATTNQSKCVVTKKYEDCLPLMQAEEVPGIMPRVDSYQNTTNRASVREPNRAPCIAAGRNTTPAGLDLCMDTWPY